MGKIFSLLMGSGFGIASGIRNNEFHGVGQEALGDVTLLGACYAIDKIVGKSPAIDSVYLGIGICTGRYAAIGAHALTNLF